jgi:hypothetical protein
MLGLPGFPVRYFLVVLVRRARWRVLRTRNDQPTLSAAIIPTELPELLATVDPGLVSRSPRSRLTPVRNATLTNGTIRLVLHGDARAGGGVGRGRSLIGSGRRWPSDRCPGTPGGGRAPFGFELGARFWVLAGTLEPRTYGHLEGRRDRRMPSCVAPGRDGSGRLPTRSWQGVRGPHLRARAARECRRGPRRSCHRDPGPRSR